MPEIPEPSLDDIESDPVSDYEYCRKHDHYSAMMALAYIRRAVHAEAQLARIQDVAMPRLQEILNTFPKDQ